MSVKAIQISDKDNVATLTSEAKENTRVEVLGPGGKIVAVLEARGAIPFGHKVALKRLGKGEQVLKYGEVIGVATEEIHPGEWVHTHNVVSARLDTGGEDVRGVVS